MPSTHPALLPPPAASAVSSLTPLTEVTHLVITHLSPKAINALEKVIRAMTEGRTAAKPKLVLSNLALRLLQASWGEQHRGAPFVYMVVRVIANILGCIYLNCLWTCAIWVSRLTQVLLASCEQQPLAMYHLAPSLHSHSFMLNSNLTPPPAPQVRSPARPSC